MIVSCLAWERKTWVFAPTFYFGKNRAVDNLSIIGKLREISESVISGTDLELVHVEIRGSDKNPTIRIFIDRPEGITHDDCSRFSAAISEIIDREDLTSSAFVLEVSSPGIERGLYSLKDFVNFSGSPAKVKTRVSIEGQRNFRGKIAGVEGNTVLFEDITNGLVRFGFDDVSKANLEVDLSEEFKKSGKRKK